MRRHRQRVSKLHLILIFLGLMLIFSRLLLRLSNLILLKLSHLPGVLLFELSDLSSYII